jgi:hypothetical protein
VRPQPELSWVIQKIHYRDHVKDATFWEAFPVPADSPTTEADDIFEGNVKRPFGTVTVTGLMQHYSFGGEAPPGMRPGGAEMSDDEQYSSEDPPPFWNRDDGTPHTMVFTWGNTGGTFETDPNSLEPMPREHYFEVGRGMKK